MCRITGKVNVCDDYSNIPNRPRNYYLYLANKLLEGKIISFSFVFVNLINRTYLGDRCRGIGFIDGSRIRGTWRYDTKLGSKSAVYIAFNARLDLVNHQKIEKACLSRKQIFILYTLFLLIHFETAFTDG